MWVPGARVLVAVAEVALLPANHHLCARSGSANPSDFTSKQSELMNLVQGDEPHITIRISNVKVKLQ